MHPGGGIVERMAFSVLFVCTGNICRSPIAERLLRARVADRAPVVAASAGIRGLPEHPIDGSCALALRELGGDPGGHVSRRLSQQLIAGADLILTAETAHLSEIVQSEPLAFRRIFTMREFGRLGSGLVALPPTPAVLRTRVVEIGARRGSAPPAGADEDDIADPFGASLRVVRACARQIAEAVDECLLALGLPP